MGDTPLRVVMVSETHWDRAWYLPFEVFRMRLVRLVDRALAILDGDPDFKCFMLDGQMLPVEDYLALRPERRADLARLVRAGRLLIGPWYALADEYLVSPEALVRNLILGMRSAEAFGACMREGYVPDAFGHINQLPQILAGFGIASAIFWRGIGDEGEALGDQFWWQAPDGTRVLAIHLPDGYHNAANLGYPMRWGDPTALPFDMEAALERITRAVALLKPRARVPLLLLMNGIDHAEADPHVPAVIAYANRALPDLHIEHASLAQYVTDVRAACRARGQELGVFEGEFNRGRYAVTLQGVYSTRIYLKQANERSQTLLERYAEPLAAWAWTLGAPYPAAFLDHAWRLLLQNQPHDDICGCSADVVHRENMVRYEQVQQVGEIIARDSFRQVAGHVDRRGRPGVPTLVYNPLAWPYSGTVEVDLWFDRDDPLAGNFHLVDAAGQPVACQVLARAEHFEMEMLKGQRKTAVRCVVRVMDLPSCGYRVYYAMPGALTPTIEQPVEARTENAGGATLENRFLRVDVRPDGTLDLLDKLSGRTYGRQAYLLDEEDAGDAYDYAPAQHGAAVRSLGGQARVALLYRGPLAAACEIRLELNVPRRLAPDRSTRDAETVVCPVQTTVTVRYDSPALELRTQIDNRAEDHRLRVCFPTGLAANEAAAGGHYDVISRPIAVPLATGWEQPPVPAHHQRGFVDISDGRDGLAVFSRGLPEYEILASGAQPGDNTITVTLLRCVGAISRGDLLTRPSHAGVPLPTPEAQCQGRHTFEYAIYPHRGDWRGVYRAAAAYDAGLCVRRADEREGYLPGEVWVEHSPNDGAPGLPALPPALDGELPAEMSFLRLAPEALVLSAVKRSESGEALIVRCYNPTPATLAATLQLYCPVSAAYLADLREEKQAELPVGEDNRVSFTVGAKQVKTLWLQPGGRTGA
jgi:mannosylglycerate hydrolase